MMQIKLKRTLGLCILIMILSLSHVYGTTPPTTPPTTTPAASDVVDPVALSKTEGEKHGAEFGKVAGAQAGLMEQLQGYVSQWTRNYPSTEMIKVKYGLTYENNNAYLDAFLKGYSSNYEASYNTAYRDANIARLKVTLVTPTQDAAELAKAESAYMACLDLVRNLPNDWSRAFKEMTQKSSLVTRYRLDRESDYYRLNFLATFETEFRLAYTITYQELNKKIELKNINYVFVSMYEARVQANRVYGEVVAGSPADKTFKPAEIVVPKGAIYQDTYIGFHWIQNSFNGNNTLYDPVTHQYRVTIGNQTGSVKLYKPINISFDFDGNERVGVYEWRYGRWLYVPTVQTADKVSIDIPAGNYSGGQYALFIDNEYKTPRDLAFNWSFKDVMTSIRRGHIGSGDFFRPSDSMSRGELADLVYRTMNYRTVTPPNSQTISDLSKAQSHQNAVKYAVGMRYMFLDTQNRFNPTTPVTYKDVETTVSNILMRSFSFSEVATKMMYEKYQRTAYSTNKLGLLKRSEAVYLFNEFVK